MLFYLTGDIQTGKTRWLLRQIDMLEANGTHVCGVVAPGTWIDHGNSFEKTGIDNLLLPACVLVPFARRLDIAHDLGEFDVRSQAARANLRWAIDESALARVNDHFAQLARIVDPGKRLLVVDELGILELEREGGLTEAVALIDRGSTPAFPDALVVVRTGLLETARTRFSAAPWNGMQILHADEPDSLENTR